MLIRSFVYLLLMTFSWSSLIGQENEVKTKDQPSLHTGDDKDKASDDPVKTKDQQDSDTKDTKDAKDAKDTHDNKVKTKDKDTQAEEEPPKVGNFSLPVSQQPAALFGFGGNIIDQSEVQLYCFADNFNGKKRIITDVIPSVLFGVTKDLTIFFNFPFTPVMREGPARSSGLEDFFVQLEYAFYTKSTKIYADQATVVANITVPTGSIKLDPPTGFGAPSLFIGGTYYRTWVDWIVFVGPGAVLTGTDHGTKVGDQFLYQFGFGRHIPSPKGWIYAWMIEVDGQYSKKNRIQEVIDHNSGGNVIYITPSLWISSKSFILQFGISLPVNQNLFGQQRKVDYALNLNVAWSFY